MQSSALRTRWAAIGAAVAVTLGAGGVGLVAATSPTGAVAYVPIEPCRAADTRPGSDNVGPRITPLGAAETHVVNSNHGQCSGDVPLTATGLQLNVTAVGATTGSFLTIWATGTRPLASSLNPTPGQPPVPNAVTTGITAAGNFNIYNNVGSVNIIVDIVGYYTDHNHDDRYYTEAEVDAAVAAAKSVAAYAGGDQQVALAPADAVIRSVSITAPADGKVIVNSSGYIWLASGVDVIARCSLTTEEALDADAFQFVNLQGEASPESDVISGTKGFDVTAGQLLTVNLVCDEFSGEANVSDTWIAATFTPD